jgi:hypothetical protein
LDALLARGDCTATSLALLELLDALLGFGAAGGAAALVTAWA